jgi:hypothetical protein
MTLTPLPTQADTALIDNGAPEPGDAEGVHAITRTTNYWFEREAHMIERAADDSALEWAQKGLPRHDLPRTEPFQPEQVLAGRCAALFRDWQQRVKTKLQDAIEATARQLDGHVATFREKVTRLTVLAHELREREQRIERIRRETERDERPVRYAQLIRPHWFWIGAVALGTVEFMANFPVFRLLLPMNVALARVAGNVADRIDPESMAAGLVMLLAEWATHVEAVVVALVAVVVLVSLGKFAGRSARAHFALYPADYPTAEKTIRAHQREQRFKGWASLAGILCVLAFMFLSRASIAETTAERVKQDRIAEAAATQRLSDAQARQAIDEIGPANEALATLRDVRIQHEEDERYALTVQRNNVPILLLNLALVITAAVLGYAAAHADLGEKRGEHPDMVKLRDRCMELHREQLDVDQEARAAAAQAHAAVSRVQHLLGAQPLRGWESKVSRLESIIPRFRGENARARGLDPANIRAFDQPPHLDLPPIDEHTGVSEPTEFGRMRAELQELMLAHAQLAPFLPERAPASGA